MATRHGVVKKTKLSEFDTRLKGGLIAIGLGKEDELQWVVETDGSREILIVTEHGMSIRFPEEQVRFMGRTAAGVRGINLRNGDAVVGMGVVREDCAVLVATREGYGKRTNATEYRSQSRGGKGIKTLNVTPKERPPRRHAHRRQRRRTPHHHHRRPNDPPNRHRHPPNRKIHPRRETNPPGRKRPRRQHREDCDARRRVGATRRVAHWERRLPACLRSPKSTGLHGRDVQKGHTAD